MNQCPRCQSDILVKAGKNARGWEPSEIILDSLLLDFPTDLPEGTYHLQRGHYDRAIGQRMEIVQVGEFNVDFYDPRDFVLR